MHETTFTSSVHKRANCLGIQKSLINQFGIFNIAANRSRGKLGKPAYLEKWVSTLSSVSAGDATFNINLEWEESLGLPGAFIIKNHHHSQLYLKTVTLDNVLGQGRLHFICNSWVYPAHRYKYDRVFFLNKVFLDHWNEHTYFQRSNLKQAIC